MQLLFICVGGALGTGVRYLVNVAMVEWLGPVFPYGTLTVNLVGSFIIGIVQEVGLGPTPLISDDVRLFVTVGMMGGLTTYSTFSYETVKLMEAGAWPQAWMNVIVTTVLCLTLCFAGIAVGRAVVGVMGAR
jgi:fluoride exporter